MIKIRPYELKDKSDVELICIRCADIDCTLTNKNNYLLERYCRYYIEKEPQNCFVAVNEDDKVIGYVISTINAKKYVKEFCRSYLPKIKMLFPQQTFASKIEAFYYFLVSARYPSHLHIDVLEEYQRMGIGHKLVDELIAHLKRNGSKGVMLSVGADNEKGINFYKKYGFKPFFKCKYFWSLGIKF